MSEEINVGGVVDYDAVQGWLEVNHDLLTTWLTNIITITKIQAMGTHSIFQLFRVPIST